ncbi:MAG: hypothetical protein QOG64_2579, partial [Acidimicrobiaceae bacterium]|nr:hypothetical protein [Acidimicrobiaceae bacterium]
GRVGVGEMVVSKNMLGQVHQCERWFLAEEREGFAWSARSAAGTVAHKAIELLVFCRDAPPPMDLVDRAIDRLIESGGQWGPGEVLSTWSEAEMAELRSDASDRVTKFLECFPPLKREWWPVLESRARVELCERRIVLKGKVDLSLGRRSGDQARVLLVDFKTGAPHRSHVDDLRFYALLETIRSGVPPFRVASYYLDAARWHHEDITEDLLEATVHRVAEGATKLIELRIDERPPTTNPGPACGFCPDRDDCDGAERWSQERVALGLDG